jgi:hypothetical protein
MNRLFETYKEYTQRIDESLITLSSLLKNKRGYDIEIKNVNALDSQEENNSLVIKVNQGNIQKLVDDIIDIYNFDAEIDETNKTIIFKEK